jgi:hypothetical protein
MYACISFFKHDNHKELRKETEILEELLKLVYSKLGYEERKTIEKKIQNVLDKSYRVAARLEMNEEKSREKYYKYCRISEERRNQIIKKGIEKTSSETFFQLIDDVCKSLFYRNENYILPSTVIHVVEIEQSFKIVPTKEKHIKLSYCKPKHNIQPICVLNDILYLLSSIEQLGYLQYYLIKHQRSCVLDGMKYLGRFLRAIQFAFSYVSRNEFNIDVFFFENDLEKMQKEFKEEMEYRKQNVEKNDLSVKCSNTRFNIKKRILDLLITR